MKTLRLLHRYVGLSLVVFILLVSVTGSLLAFNPELDRVFAPAWYTEVLPGKQPLSLPELAQAAQRVDSEIQVTDIWLNPGQAKVGVGGATGYSEIVLNPYTGELLGTRSVGNVSEGWHNLMPFIYEFHYSLMLDDTGIWILDIAALVWFVDCFTGLIITFPRWHAASGKAWFTRWKKAWKIKPGSAFPRLNFDIHRAFSLWLWVVLGVFAWSSVYMNLWDTTYTQITRALMPYHPPWYELADRDATRAQPPYNWNEVYVEADSLMQKLAKEDGFSYQPQRLTYRAGDGYYRYRVLSSMDVSNKLARTDIYLDARSLQLLLKYYPSGQYVGNTVSNWLHALHTARVWGVTYQIVVCLLGVVLIIITLSGALIWWQRRSRRGKRQHQPG